MTKVNCNDCKTDLEDLERYYKDYKAKLPKDVIFYRDKIYQQVCELNQRKYLN